MSEVTSLARFRALCVNEPPDHLSFCPFVIGTTPTPIDRSRATMGEVAFQLEILVEVSVALLLGLRTVEERVRKRTAKR